MKIIKSFITTIGFGLSLFKESSYALQPSKMPSGNYRKYIPNKLSPYKDLKSISGKESSFISRHWLNNIIQSNKIGKEDINIIENINILEEHIQNLFSDSEQVSNIYFSWIPDGGYMKDILFIVVFQVHDDRNVLKLLIQSPYWDSSQINSKYLLNSLEDFCKISNRDLDLFEFYEDNIRFKLEWYNLNLKLDEKKK
tara:strand:- start:307 stop:897 length:591 start_codon:yes stop_codon:yes gene_type:complete